MTTVYIDLQGTDREHTEYLSDTVSGLTRGFGLSIADAESGYWPGGCDRFWIDEYGEQVRLAAGTFTREQGERLATVLRDYLLANAWGDGLVAIFVRYDDGSSQAVHGRARSFVEAAGG